MKIVDAFWEKRNIGVECAEITFSREDEISLIKNSILKEQREYTVCKVPSGMNKIVDFLQKEDFYFIEMLTHCHRLTAQLPELNSVQNRIYKNISFSETRMEEKEIIFEKIRQGLLNDDRISMDEYFTQELANNRYIGWINDELERGAVVYSIKYKGKLAAFFGMKKNNARESFAFIGGVFPEYQGYGIGYIMNYLEILQARNDGSKIVQTAYSSNNRGASAIHLSLGYILDENYYVFIKHK